MTGGRVDYPSWSFARTRETREDALAETDVMAVMVVGFVIRAALFPRKLDWPLLSMRTPKFYICALKFYMCAPKFYILAAKFNMRARKFYMRGLKIVYLESFDVYLRSKVFILSKKNTVWGQNRTINGG